MPGVPSSRGCNACRKQKKKCDAGDQGLPCARCKRLNITCQGFGQQRYKFQDEGKKLSAADKLTSNRGARLTLRQQPSFMQFPRNPSNSMTQLASAFVGKIDPTADIRYQLVWNFGAYLADIPRRLGTNPALDAASDALVAAHTNFCSNGHGVPDYAFLAKYSRALNVLRDELDDPDKAHSSETLCAIMLLMIIQVLTNPTKGFAASHSQGAAQVLKSGGSSGPRNDFERKQLLTLRGPVVFETLAQDNIRFSRQEWKVLVESGLEGTDVDTEWPRCLASVPELMQRCKYALHCSSRMWGTKLPDLISETNSLLEDCKTNITALRERLRSFENNPLPSGMTDLLHAHHIRMLSLALMTGILLSCILSSLLGEPLQMSTESYHWSHEIFDLAEAAVKFQPLGSAAMIFCLYVAWIGTPGEDIRDGIKALLVDYEKACLGHASSTDPRAALESIERRFRLVEPYSYDAIFETSLG